MQQPPAGCMRISVADADDACSSIAASVSDFDELACTYEFLELDDAPVLPSEQIIGLVICNEPNRQGDGSDIPLSVLKAVQDTFAAVIPTIMNGVQTRVDQATECLDSRVEAQKCQIASLARHMAAIAASTVPHKQSQKMSYRGPHPSISFHTPSLTVRRAVVYFFCTGALLTAVVPYSPRFEPEVGALLCLGWQPRHRWYCRLWSAQFTSYLRSIFQNPC